MHSHPGIADEVLRLEHTAMSLHPNAKLYGRKTLLEMFEPTQPRDRARLEALEREPDMPCGRSTTCATCSRCPRTTGSTR
ncbi:hypothetical protein ACIQU3_36615 [Streptomyces sp. NPDC101110]|uniref:hypothetical protein n=1 Tax=Streptomyces sp. NPDC101110 TaxID=3366104 RepID=UPI00382195F8